MAMVDRFIYGCLDWFFRICLGITLIEAAFWLVLHWTSMYWLVIAIALTLVIWYQIEEVFFARGRERILQEETLRRRRMLNPSDFFTWTRAPQAPGRTTVYVRPPRLPPPSH